jgi:hypothetical protein
MMKYAVLVALLILVAFPIAGNTQTPSALDGLEHLLGLDLLPADHVILIDLSGSMRWEPIPGSQRNAREGSQRLDIVLEALPDLLRAIPEGDYIRVLGFHDSVVGAEVNELVRDNWVGTESATLEYMAAIRRNLRIGNDTDFGLALDEALSKLTRDPHNPLQYVYLLTDGENDPPDNSIYSGSFDSSESWRSLNANWDGLFASVGPDSTRERQVLKVFLFGLFDVSSAGVLGQVFSIENGELKVLLFSNPQDLQAYFSEIRSNIRHEFVRARLEQLRRSGAWVVSDTINESIEPPCTIFVSITSSFYRLETRGNLSLSIDSMPGLSYRLLDSALTIPPGGSDSARISIGYSPLNKGFFSLQRSVSIPVHMTLSFMDAQLEPIQLLDAAGFRDISRFQIQSYEKSFTIAYTEGTLPRWTLVVPVLLLLLAAYFMYRFLPRSISGRLLWRDLPSGEQDPGEKLFRGKGSIRIDSSTDSAVRNTLLPARFIELHSKPRGLFGRGIELEVHAHGITMNGKRIPCGSGAPLKRTCTIQYEQIAVQLNNVRTKLTGG